MKIIIGHLHLLFYNFIRWQERTKLLNNERKKETASLFVFVILVEWLIFIVMNIKVVFNFDIGFIKKNVYWIAIPLVVFILILRTYFLKIYEGFLEGKEAEYSRIINWKKSKYRKRALIYTVIYFCFFIPGLIIYLSFLNKLIH